MLGLIYLLRFMQLELAAVGFKMFRWCLRRAKRWLGGCRGRLGPQWWKLKSNNT